MKPKKLMNSFLEEIEKSGKLTNFIRYIKENKDINDYNYIYRKSLSKDKIILDIYDNISSNCFNRYIFLFDKEVVNITTEESNNIYIHYISIYSTQKAQSNIERFAYLFSLNNDSLVEYAKTIFDKSLFQILSRIIKAQDK